MSWAWWDWPLTSLTNHCPSVLRHCRLGHLTHKIDSEMTYNVSSGTLNTTTHTFSTVYVEELRLRNAILVQQFAPVVTVGVQYTHVTVAPFRKSLFGHRKLWNGLDPFPGRRWPEPDFSFLQLIFVYVGSVHELLCKFFVLSLGCFYVWFYQHQSSDWSGRLFFAPVKWLAGRSSPKWPVMCQVRR